MAKRGFKKSGRIILAFLLLMFAIGIVRGDIPQTFNIHGRLTNAAESPLSGTYVMNFSIYNNPTAGNTLWSSGNMSVTTDSNGVYNLILQNIALPFSEQYFLATRIEGDEEMLPRINLSSSPYTFRANVSDNLNETGNYQTKNLNLTGGINTSLIYTSGGKIGIGTTNPGSKFDVIGDISITAASRGFVANDPNTVTVGGALRVRKNDGTEMWASGLRGTVGTLTNDLYFTRYYGGSWSDVMVMQQSSGNVGIGTTSPASLLEITRQSGKNEVNLSGVVYVNSTSGYVGIGTTAPGAPLDVVSSAAYSESGQDVLRLRAIVSTGAIGSGPVLSFTNAGGTELANIRMFLEGGNNFGIGFGVYNTGMSENVLYIKSTGNVGINSISPNALLEVNGGANISGPLNVSNAKVRIDSSGNINTTGTLNTSVLYMSGGNVGIGTAAPTGALQVGDVSAANMLVSNSDGTVHIRYATDARLFFVTNAQNSFGNAYDSIGGDGGIRLGKTGAYSYIVGGTNILLNPVAGNVGIGSTSPNALLEVNGGVNISGPLNISTTKARIDSSGNINTTGNINTSVIYTSGGNVGIGTTAPGNLLEVGRVAGKNEVNLSGVMYVNSTSGNVGIGTAAPTALFEVMGSSSFPGLRVFSNEIMHAFGTLYIYTRNQGGALNFYNSGVSSYISNPTYGGNINLVPGEIANVLISSGLRVSGNVGIGSTSPNALLEVNGGTNISGPMNVSTGKARIDSSGNINTTGNINTSVIYTSGGNVGIGTASPGSKLTVYEGDLNVSNGARGTMFYVQNSSGNVGINTTNPSASLHVVGNVIINGSLTYTASDPEAETFYPATRQRVTELVNEYVPPEKDGGLTLFFNNDTDQFEAYSHVKNKFYKFQLTELNQTGLAEGSAASTNASGVYEQKSGEPKSLTNSSGQIYWNGSKLVIKVT